MPGRRGANEVRALQGDVRLALDGLAKELGDARQVHGVGVECNGGVQHVAASAAPREVANADLEEVGVGDDDLLAVHAADARGLEPHLLDRALVLVDDNVVAEHEGLVEDDGQRGEEVAEDVLHRQRDGDAADAEAGDERRDVDAVVLQREQNEQAPQHEAHAEAEGRHRGAVGLARVVAGPLLQPERDDDIGPREALQDEREDLNDAHRFVRGRRKIDERIYADERDEDEERCLDATHDLDGEVIGHRVGLRGELGEAALGDGAQHPEQGHAAGRRGDSLQPALRRVAEETRLRHEAVDHRGSLLRGVRRGESHGIGNQHPVAGIP